MAYTIFETTHFLHNSLRLSICAHFYKIIKCCKKQTSFKTIFFTSKMSIYLVLKTTHHIISHKNGCEKCKRTLPGDSTLPRNVRTHSLTYPSGIELQLTRLLWHQWNVAERMSLN